MATKPGLLNLATGLLAGLAIGGTVAWSLARTHSPSEPPAESVAVGLPSARGDAELVESLLAEDLSDRRFSFATIAEACSGKRVVPLDDSPAHQRVTAAIRRALAATLHEMNQPDSPVRKLRRINEASRYFEDGLLTRIDAMPGLGCDIPPTRSGERQRSGYPDLRIVDEESGTVFYLDPKLVEQGSIRSSFRTFYFEPKDETLKITDDAVHLLAGIEHDGRTRRWTFTGWRLVDLSNLRVRLKAEFQTSNRGLYEGVEFEGR